MTARVTKEGGKFPLNALLQGPDAFEQVRDGFAVPVVTVRVLETR